MLRRIKIHKKEVLRQLPEKAGYLLIQYLDQMPESFIFEGFDEIEPSEELVELYPEIRKAMTEGEWKIFVKLCIAGKRVKGNTLYQPQTRSDSLDAAHNGVSVMIKNVRRKLRILKSKFEVVTHRNHAAGPGSCYYELVSPRNE